MKKILLMFILAGVQTTFAQTTVPITGANGTSQAKFQGFLSSLQYFAAGNFATAEGILEQPNVQQTGTPSWDRESAFDLLKVAHYFDNSGNRSLATSIAALALGHLQKADSAYTAANAAAEVANEKELQGNIYEHFAGNRAAAEAFYAAAVALSPNTGLAAASLARLRQMDAADAMRQAQSATGQ